ncbi:MAG: type II secretion system F family protein [Planctomycetota bacterium]|jgi:type IV pilus assembly protein PilC|nr:type II secretion system F family protein [Planctomycetota bacterium]
MPVFVYDAVDNKGKKLSNEIEAPSQEEARAQLQNMGYYPSSIREKGGGGSKRAGGSIRKKKGGGISLGGGVSTKQLTAFTSQLSTLQDAGLPIVRSLKILEGQMKPGVLKNSLSAVADDVETGSTFSEALSKHPKIFDRLFVNMVRAGEAGGVLDTILQRLSEFMEKSQKLKKQIVGASIYPAAVIMIAGGILSVIMIMVVPQFEKIFKDIGTSLPVPTQVLLDASNVLVNQWYLLPLVPMLFFICYKLVVSTAGGKYFMDNFKLNVPVFGTILRKSAISRFTRTLGTLITSGVPILEALSIVRNAIGNEVVAKAIGTVHDAIREGESIAEPMAESGVFDDLVINMIDVGEETGELDKMLMKIADNYDNDVDVAVSSMISLLEPMLIIFMGGAVGFIVIALFMPLIDLVQKLG